MPASVVCKIVCFSCDKMLLQWVWQRQTPTICSCFVLCVEKQHSTQSVEPDSTFCNYSPKTKIVPNRPVLPISARWEKNRSVRHAVQNPDCSICVTPARIKFCWLARAKSKWGRWLFGWGMSSCSWVSKAARTWLTSGSSTS